MPAPRRITNLLADMRKNPAAIRFTDALAVAEYFFGKPRIAGSHHVFKMPWPGNPRINLQDSNRSAKPYQVRQILAAVERLNNGR